MSRQPSRNLRTRLLPRLVGGTRRLPPGLLLATRPALAGLLYHVSGWRPRVERSMRAALGEEQYSPVLVREYFRRLADLLAYAPVVYHRGLRSGLLDREWEIDAASHAHLRAAHREERGVLLVSPHLMGHEVMAGVMARELPMTVLVRRSPDPTYEALKQQWYGSLGVQTAYRGDRDSPHADLADMTAAFRALRKNRFLAVTPDLVRGPGSGVRVRLFGRPVHLPAGAFFLAVRLGAPLVPAFFHREGGRYRLWAHPPLAPPAGEGRDAGVATLAQQWTDLFEAFLREHPEMWQFWLDKRWARWLDRPAPGASGPEAA